MSRDSTRFSPGTGAFDWGEIAGRLAPRYRTVVFDLRGHGRSSHEGEEFGVVRFGLDTVHVLRALGLERAVLVGFSVGGNTLLGLLARDPRPALALVTIGASARGDPGRVQEIMAGPWPDYLTGLDHEVGSGPEYWRELRALLAHDWAQNVSLDDEALRRITCPTLVCHGDRDRVQPLGLMQGTVQVLHLVDLRHGQLIVAAQHAALFVAEPAKLVGVAEQIDQRPRQMPGRGLVPGPGEHENQVDPDQFRHRGAVREARLREQLEEVGRIQRRPAALVQQPAEQDA